MTPMRDPLILVAAALLVVGLLMVASVVIACRMPVRPALPKRVPGRELDQVDLPTGELRFVRWEFDRLAAAEAEFAAKAVRRIEAPAWRRMVGGRQR